MYLCPRKFGLVSKGSTSVFLVLISSTPMKRWGGRDGKSERCVEARSRSYEKVSPSEGPAVHSE